MIRVNELMRCGYEAAVLLTARKKSKVKQRQDLRNGQSVPCQSVCVYVCMLLDSVIIVNKR